MTSCRPVSPPCSDQSDMLSVSPPCNGQRDMLSVSSSYCVLLFNYTLFRSYVAVGCGFVSAREPVRQKSTCRVALCTPPPRGLLCNRSRWWPFDLGRRPLTLCSAWILWSATQSVTCKQPLSPHDENSHPVYCQGFNATGKQYFPLIGGEEGRWCAMEWCRDEIIIYSDWLCEWHWQSEEWSKGRDCITALQSR